MWINPAGTKPGPNILPKYGGSLTHDWVMLANFTPDAPVDFEIKAADDQVLYSSIVGQNGFYWMDADEHGIDLEPGMVLTAIDTITSDIKVLELESLVVSSTNYVADTVGGIAPPNTTVNARVYWNNWQDSYELDVLSDGSGNWLADFGSAGMDLLPYMVAESTIRAIPMAIAPPPGSPSRLCWMWRV